MSQRNRTQMLFQQMEPSARADPTEPQSSGGDKERNTDESCHRLEQRIWSLTLRVLLPRCFITIADDWLCINKENILDIFLSLIIALRVFLHTLPVTVTGERYFSLQKHIETYLKSVISQENLHTVGMFVKLNTSLCFFTDAISDGLKCVTKSSLLSGLLKISCHSFQPPHQSSSMHGAGSSIITSCSVTVIPNIYKSGCSKFSLKS